MRRLVIRFAVVSLIGSWHLPNRMQGIAALTLYITPRQEPLHQSELAEAHSHIRARVRKADENDRRACHVAALPVSNCPLYCAETGISFRASCFKY